MDENRKRMIFWQRRSFCIVGQQRSPANAAKQDVVRKSNWTHFQKNLDESDNRLGSLASGPLHKLNINPETQRSLISESNPV
jgi:hypothetical protein